LRATRGVEEVGKSLAGLGALFGMPGLMIIDVEAAAKPSPAAVLFSARSLSDLRSYHAQYPLAANPLFRRSWECETPCSLSEVKDELNFDDEQVWSHLPSWTRGKQGLSINVPSGPRGRVNLWFGGRDPEVAGVCGAARSALFVASSLAVEHLTELERGGERPKLTKREIEVLRLVAAGKTDDDAGAALGIAARTVRFHIENAKSKLNVTTRAQAVLMVLRGEIG
jgi:DNA-binding CsgD family transcriptional regulator